jgi:integrase
MNGWPGWRADLVASRNLFGFDEQLRYPASGCQCRLNKGGVLFRRTRYQQGSLNLEERKKGPAVWVYRWWEKDINGNPIRRKSHLGDASEYPTKSGAQAAADALRLTINNHSQGNGFHRTTVNTLWEHYRSEELPLKEVSTQDVYGSYVRNWILPRWGRLLLDEVKTVEVERWLRAADIADGTKAKIKNIMSALFSHAVRWEFCGRNPISSGIQVGSGGKRGPSVGVRVSTKRQRAPLVLSSEQVKQGLAGLQFRDQLLLFLIGALGTRRGEVGGLRWTDCDFTNQTFYIQHSYYWGRGGSLKGTKSEASTKPLPMHPSLKNALLEWRAQSLYVTEGDFVFPSVRKKGKKPLDLGAVLNRMIKPAFAKVGIAGVGWHTFRHSVGSMLADMGEHQLTIRDYLRHSHLNVTNQYLQATSKTKRLAQDKLVEAILPSGLLSASKSNLIQ